MDRTCKKCNKALPIESFPEFTHPKNGKVYREWQCVECRSEYHRKYNKAHKERYAKCNRRHYLQKRAARLLYAKEYRKSHVEEIKQAKLTLRQRKEIIIEQAKDKPCADCGKQFPRIAMDFDHVRGEKKDEIAQMVNSAYSIETLLQEIAKCELVCANCHRVRTALRLHLKSIEHFGE